MLQWNPSQPNVNTNIFWACTQATVTFGAGLSATIQTISLSNDVSSKVNLYLLDASFAASVAPGAAAVVSLVSGFNAITNVTHTTPLTTQSSRIGSSITNSVGRCDTAATLPATPVYMIPLISVGTSLGTSQANDDLTGIYVIPPGGYVALQANAAITGFCQFTWAEVPFQF